MDGYDYYSYAYKQFSAENLVSDIYKYDSNGKIDFSEKIGLASLTNYTINNNTILSGTVNIILGFNNFGISGNYNFTNPLKLNANSPTLIKDPNLLVIYVTTRNVYSITIYYDLKNTEYVYETIKFST